MSLAGHSLSDHVGGGDLVHVAHQHQVPPPRPACRRRLSSPRLAPVRPVGRAERPSSTPLDGGQGLVRRRRCPGPAPARRSSPTTCWRPRRPREGNAMAAGPRPACVRLPRPRMRASRCQCSSTQASSESGMSPTTTRTTRSRSRASTCRNASSRSSGLSLPRASSVCANWCAQSASFESDLLECVLFDSAMTKTSTSSFNVSRRNFKTCAWRSNRHLTKI